MAESPKDALRDLFDRELDALTAQASEIDAAALSTKVETLNRLAKLIEIRDAAKPKPRNWWPAGVLVFTMAIASVLLFARIGSAEIELDATLAQLSFVLTKAQALTGYIDLSSLGVSGLREVQLPQAGFIAASSVSLTAAAPGQRHGAVSLSPLLLPAGADVTLSYSEVPNQYRIEVSLLPPKATANLPLQATANGPITIAVPGSPSITVDLASPKPVLLHAGPTDVGLDLTFPTLPQSALSPQLHVRSIAFWRTDQFLESNQTVVRRLSTVLSGTLTFESLNGEEVRLRPGEELDFQQSEGEVRSAECAAKHIDLKFYGRVRGITVGSGEGVHSIMPTYLEWLKARHGLTLLWGSGVYLFGIAAAALRWFGVKM
jgi:hypothetical protein